VVAVGAVAYLTLTATILTLLSAASTVAVATGSTTYGGTVPAPSGVTLHSVCGDSSRGLLFAVGTDGTRGMIYRIDSLTSGGYVRLVERSPPPGWGYQLSFYACEVVDDYIFVSGEVRSDKAVRGVFLVYSVSGVELNVKLTGVGIGRVQFRDIDVKKVGSYYYVYALSVVDDSIEYYYTYFDGSKFAGISGVQIGTGVGYGVSIYGSYLGLLWRDSAGNLKLEVYDISGGSPNYVRTVTVLTGFTGVRAAEAAYSDGFIVAVAGMVYRVTYGTWGVEEFVAVGDVPECNPYAVLTAEKNGAKAAYIFSQVGAPPDMMVCVVAVDLASRRVAYADTILGLEQSMEGFGDAYVVWVDPSTGDVVVPEYPDSRSYMVYTTVAGTSSSLIYYDLTRGGVLPYPVPEPWFVSLAVLASTATAVALIVRRAG